MRLHRLIISGYLTRSCALIFLLFTSDSSAAESDENVVLPRKPHHQTYMSLSLGSGTSTAVKNGEDRSRQVSGFGLTVLHVWERYQAGLAVDARSAFFGEGHFYLGPMIGRTVELRPWLFADFLAEGGAHRIACIDCGIFSTSTSDPDSVWLPYAGIRAGLTTYPGRKRRFAMGFWSIGRIDLSHETAVVTEDSCGFLGPMFGSCTLSTHMVDLGGSFFELGVSFGAAL